MLTIENILNYSVAAVSMSRCLDVVEEEINTAVKPLYLACLNPHSVHIASIDPEADEALKAADVLIPDGSGIVLASGMLDGSIPERITGSDIFWGLSNRFNEKGDFSYYFLGSTEGTLAVIKERLAVDFPGIKFAGSYSPPFKEVFSEEENRAMIEAVNQAEPDILWVGMTAPKQEKWIYQNKDKLKVKFIGAVGAVFDFYAGNVKRAHPWLQEHGLEWVARFVQEPRRLWRRTFISSSVFLLRILNQKLRSSNIF